MIGIGVQVFQVRILFAVPEGCPGRKAIAQGAPEGSFDDIAVGIVGGVELAHFDVEVARGLVEARTVGNKVHQAAGCVAPEQGALGPFEYFHPIDVEYGEGLGLCNRYVAIIKIDRVGGFDDVVEIILGDAPDRELGVLPREVARYVHAGSESGNVKAF